MFKKGFNFFISLCRGRVIFDYKALGLKRRRNFEIPALTNYIRISNFELVVQEIRDRKLNGCVAEVGVYRGEFAKFISQAFPEKKLYLFDTFEGFDEKDVKVETDNKLSLGNQDFSQTSIDEVLAKMTIKENCIVKKGYFPDSLDGLEEEFCFVSLDADLYKPILDGLAYFYPRLQKGGYIFVHDYNNELYPGAQLAVREYCQEFNIPYFPLTDAWGTVAISK